MMAAQLDVHDLEVRVSDLFRVGPAAFQATHGIIQLEGPNGSGKTTLLRALCGELLPSAGRVLVDGEDVHRSVNARRRIALVPSRPELPDFLTVREAYEFTASIRGARDWNGAAVCTELDLDPGLPLQNASDGQRKKAELVCGLVGDPPILLLDETFTHLDDASSARLRQWIVDWSSSRLVLFTRHGAPPLPASATLVLDRGKVSGLSSGERKSLRGEPTG